MFKKIANTIQAQVIALITALAFIILSLVNIFSVTTDIKVVLSVFPLIVFSIGSVLCLYNIQKIKQKK
ncbi:hypothetical protein DOS74_09235 [Staphylococcus felis]|uniref:Group-specific protein n=1 Tax=Staphylococcus felis TaxID=46127 RepID=A0AAX1RVA3_9STAP|nr:hypothetical protein [Staphylococcus felis]REH75620.1 hypothetical protein DOS59_09925 [Staphylococcus felis]REH81268.1 hypothetical protein DOS56_10740 [Staphylococcus felis]REH84316.1 hypothetical protein DOS63_07050 [Staphylococcus felis]REH98536.1 hypothetical protein DOS64_11315 [Staphylococcus felis]REI14357.1 hypothetical protein DOS74_09235 [Staphylococcus felis]